MGLGGFQDSRLGVEGLGLEPRGLAFRGLGFSALRVPAFWGLGSRGSGLEE